MLLKELYEKRWNNFISSKLTKERIVTGIKIAEKDSKKNYPLTVEENILILRKYIRLLKSNHITPIIVICPTTKYYYNNLSVDIKERFRNLINDIEDIEKIKVLDYFESNKFGENDFYDVSHLNKDGSKKFTKFIINDILKNVLK